MDIAHVIDEMITAETVSADEMLAEFFDFEAFDKPNAILPKASLEADTLDSPSADASRTTQSASKPQPHSTVSKTRQAHSNAVFIRIDKLCLIVDDVAEEFRWNKRSRTWHDEGGNNVQVGWLIENPGPLLQVSVRTNGFGFPVDLHWDLEDKSFKGETMEGRRLVIPWKELNEMVDDPWARQYQGYYN